MTRDNTRKNSTTPLNILVTGIAGFIGMHTARAFSSMGFSVYGIDNLNTYYSVELKLARLRELGIASDQIQYGKSLTGKNNLQFTQLDITDYSSIDQLFNKNRFEVVIHLAAQAGVRYSIENPHAYVDSNVKGFLNILEASVKHSINHLIFASSSSVYGMNNSVPFKESDSTERQVSLYAATKKANEAMAHSYACVHKLPVTGLRFFTVYGPWGRPDMALFKFTERVLKGEPIEVYNQGQLSRDFTYIDDIVEAVTQLVECRPSNADVPFELFNIGKGEPVALEAFIQAIEKHTGKNAKRHNMPMQPGDVEKTWADVSRLRSRIRNTPKVNLDEGVKAFVEWYLRYHQLSPTENIKMGYTNTLQQT